MRYNQEELKKAIELSRNTFNSLPQEMRKMLASPYDRLLENGIAIYEAEIHLSNLKKRKKEIEEWLMDWYHKNMEE